MLAWGDREAGRRSLYSGTAAERLCRPLRWLAVGSAVLCALANAGCSYRLASLVSKDDADVDQTESLRPNSQASTGSQPSEADLAYARAVAAEMLARGGKDNSAPWQNPQTGAGGNVTPLATSYNEGGLPCRDFLASYVHAGSEDWLQGAACRTRRGGWEVKSLKPLNHS